ncbi:MAG: hypothetical protein ACR2HG_11295 [Pyrinomonadaceae bacterium]
MTEENKERKETTLTEDLKAVGQIIVGGIETVGGILTADPITQAEGEYNVEAGNLRQEAAESLEKGEEMRRSEESDRNE